MPLNGTPVTSPSYIDTSVTAGVQYNYTVTAVDAAGHESAVSNQASATPDPSTNNALDFDGTDDHVTLGGASAFNSNTFSVETWFRRDGAGVAAITSSNPGGLTAIPLVTKGRSGGGVINWFVGIDSATNRIAADFESADDTNHGIVGSTTLVNGIWYHAAATYDGAVFRLYLNGAEEASVAVASGPGTGSGHPAALATAMDPAGVPAGFFNGVLDEVRIWNLARSDAQIYAGATQELSTGTGLIGRYGLNEGSGTGVINSVAGGVNGSAVNGPLWVGGSPFSLPDSAPAAPTGLAASAGNNSVSLSWNSNSEPDLDGYRVFRGTSTPVSTAGSPLSGATLLTAPNYLDATAVNGTTYYYVVTAVDLAGQASVGSLPASATPSSSAGGALDFDGVNDHVTLGPASGLNSNTFTIETWFRRDGTGVMAPTTSGSGGVSAAPLMAKGLSGGGVINWFMGITSDGHLAADFESASDDSNHAIIGPTTLTNGTWHHGAASYDGSNFRLYLDGVLEASATVANGPGTASNHPPSLATAMTPAGVATGFFDGVLDEARVWNLARTAGDISAARNQELTSGTGLIARYGMDEGTGTVVANSIAGGPAGTTVNGPLWVPGAPFGGGGDPPPAAPSGLIASPGNNSVALSWSANSEPDLAGYNVYRDGGPSGPSVTVAAAGDIASCSTTGDSATAALIAGIDGEVLALGDTVYPNGTATEYTNCYEPTWGAFKGRTRPVPGNHEYNTANAAGYYGYFGPAAGDPTKGYYSYDYGAWHVVVLNSNCSQVGGCGAGSPQLIWLQADLAANDEKCTLAAWHQPRFSSASVHGSDVTYQPFFQALYDAHADVILSGHDHSYERFAPQTATGVADPLHGVREFVVGTGGFTHYGLGTLKANSEVFNGDTFGVLKLTLKPTGYDWEFVPVAGQTFTDSGSDACRDASGPISSNAPLNGSTLVTGTSFVDTTAVNGTGYDYVVTAVDNADQESPASAPVSATPTTGTALDFDGVNDHVTFGNAPSLAVTNFTIETWFRRDGTGVTTQTSGGTGGVSSVVPLVTKGASENDSPANVNMNYFLGFRTTDDVLVADFEDTVNGGNHAVTGVTPITSGVWHHAAATYDTATDTWNLYLDGVLDRTLTIGNFTPESTSIQHAGMGTALNSTGAQAGFFDGALDEVRIWNVVRTPAEIAAARDLELASGTGLIARWGLNEGSGVGVGNSIAGGATGTAVNGPLWVSGAPLGGGGGNQAPVFNTDIPDQNSTEGDPINLDADATDADLDPLTYSATGLPDGISIDPASGVISGTLSAISSGSYSVIVTVSDGSLTDADSFAWIVAEPSVGETGLDFDGVNDHVTLGPASGLNSNIFTIETWFRRDGTGVMAPTTSGSGGVSAAPLMAKGLSGGGVINWFMGITSDGHLAADFESASDDSNHAIIGPTTLTNGTWHHAAATYDGSNFRLYLDGVLEDSTTVANGPGAASNHPPSLATAMTPAGVATGFFNGVLDEARVWNIARSAAQIGTGMSQELIGGVGLIARYGMDEGAGTAVANSISGGPAGTAVGGPLWVPGAPFTPPPPPNDPPAAPTLVEPLDGAFGVATDPTLSVQVLDPEGASLTTTFFGRPAGPAATPEFTIIALPDTQHYVDNAANVAHFEGQTQWIVNTRTARNIAFVTHLGDVVEHADQFEIEWQRASAAMATLDQNGVPNNLTTGNHDVNTSTGNGTFYDTYFPPSRYAGFNWYGGYLGQLVGDPVNRLNKNNYELFSVGGLDFVILHLEFDLPGYALDWAEGILNQYPNHKAIVTTHLFVNTTNQRPTSAYSRPDGTSPEAAWQRLRTHCNVVLVLNGHYPGEGRRTDNNACGDPVHQLLADYQERANGGDGWLRIMTFKPAENKVDVQTYSPTLNAGAGQFETDANSQFSLDMDLAGGAPFEEIATVTGTPSGGTASTTWPGLAGTTDYEWYAVVNDGNGSTSGANWTFTTTVDNVAPAAPSDLAATPGANSVSLTWTANTEPDLAGYNVHRSTSSPVSTAGTPLNGLTLVAGPSYLDSTAVGDTEYFYVVTAVDVSDNESGASNQVSATPTVPSGSALSFDGTNDHVTFGNAAGLNATDFTIETWFRRDGTGATTSTGTGGLTSIIPLVTKGRGEADGSNLDMNWFLGIDSTTNVLAADFEDTATGLNHPVSGTTVIASDSVWHHAAVTYSAASDTWNLYLDGNLERNLPLGGNFTPRADSIQHAGLATALTSTGVAAGFFNGALDEVRIWNVARSAAQVAAMRDLAISTPRTGLIARYGLDEGTGTSIASSISGAPAGTLVNGPAWVVGAPITPAGPNGAPVFVTDLGDLTLDEGNSVNLDADATDADFDTLTYTASGLPTGITINPATGVISGTLLDGTNGVYSVTLTVSDGNLTDDDTFSLTVNDVDAPPAAPTGLAAVAGNGSVGLSWDANGEPDVAGYRVFRATTLPVSTTGDGLGGAALISGTSYTDLTVFNGTTYNYVVIAVDAAANRSTASAPASATPSANAGSALDFDGTNDHVTFGTATALGAQSFTIETWFRRDGLGLNTSTGTGGLTTIIPLVTKGRGEAEGSNVDMNWFLGIDTKGTATEADDTLGADFEDNATGLNHPVTGITPVPTSATWHHAAVTYDTATDTWNLYLDGNLERTLSAGGNFTPRSDSIQHAGLATAMTSTGVTAGFFAGVLDEVRIWNTARSAAQIQAARYQQLTSGSGLVARYGLNENTGTAVASSVAGAPAGTAVNGPLWVTGFPLPDLVPPAAPSGLAAAPGNTLVTLSWNANGESDLAGYRLFRSTSSPVATTGNGLGGASLITGTSFTDTSAANDTLYYYALIAVDSSANRSSASAEASATPSLAAGSALRFDGLNDYVTFGNAAGLNVTDFSIETWFRRTGAGVGVTTGGGGIASAIPLVAKGAQQAETPLNINMNWFLGIDATSGVLVADFEDKINGGNHPVAGLTPVTSNVWHHAAATYDATSGTWKLYLDGVLDRTLVLASAFSPENTSIQHGSLGSSLNSTGGTNGFFAGALDEVRLWNVVRSDAQIAATMNNTLTSGSGLIARYGLDEGSGLSTASSVAGAPGGTLTNGPAWIVGPPLSPFANQQPTFDQDLGDRTDAEGDLVSLSAGATDPDGDPLTYEATGLPAGLAIDAGTGLISGTLDYAAAAGSPYAVTITVRDGLSVDDSDTFSWSVTNTNRAPAFTTDITDQNAAEGDAVSLDADATDPDGDPLIYSATGLPAGLSIDPFSGIISGTLDFGSAGIHNVTVSVTDGTLSDDDSFTLTVSATNQEPTFDQDLGDRTDAEGDLVSLSAGATDPDGDPLTYEATGLPAGLAIDAGTGLISGTLDYAAAAGSPYAVTITVRDGLSVDDSDTFSWSVTNTNRAPAFTTDITDQNAAEGDAVSLDADATDADADTLIYSATGLPAGLSIDPFSGIISGTLDFGSAGIHNVTVSVTDGTLSDDDSFTLTVSATNQEPTFDQDLGDRTDAEGDLVSLSAGATDPDGDPLTYEATGLPAGLAIDAGTGLISGTLDYAAAAGSPYAVTITVRDGLSVDDSDTFSWTVNNTNRAPAFTTDITDQNAAEGDAVSLDADATDPDADTLIYSAAGLPADLTIDANSGIISGTLGFSSAGVYNVSVTVSDGTLTDDDTFSWTVTNTNQAPLFSTDITDQSNAEGDSVNLDADATDPDGDPLIYSATGLPDGVGIDFNTGLISGTLSSSSAGVHNVTVTASDGLLTDTDTFSWTVDEPAVGSGLDFDGVDDHVTFGAASGLNSNTFTIEAWFRRDGTGTPATTSGSGGVTAIPLVTKGLSQSGQLLNWFLGIDSATNRLAADFESASDDSNHGIIGTTTIANGTWYHAAATYDGTTFRLFLNGAQEASVAVANGPGMASAHHAALATAMTSTGAPTGRFDGAMDEIRIWNLARSAAQLVARRDQELLSSYGLLARYGLAEATGTTINNSVAGGVNGTAVGGPIWSGGAPVSAPANQTPVFTTDIANQNHDEGNAVNLDADATDADFDTLVYSATGLPGGVTINSSTGAISGTLSGSSSGTHNVVVTVSDGTDTDTDTFTWTVSDFNSALDFDGTNDHVTFGIASALGLSTFTIETWFRRDGAGVATSTGTGGITNAIPLVTKGRGEGDQSNVDANWFLGIDAASGVLVADFEDFETPSGTNNNHPVTGITAIPISATWHHAAVTYDSATDTWNLYLDGNLERNLPLGGNFTPRADSIQHAGLATALTSTGVAAGFFNGALDEVRIWNVARSAAQVAAMRDLAISTPRTGLIARYGLDEGTGTSIASSISGAPAGTLVNGPAWVVGAPITPAGPNGAPVFVTDLGDLTLDEGNSVNLDADATDADFDTLTYTASGLPTGITINPATGVISGTLLDGTNGVYSVTLTVSDGNLTDDDTFSLTVNDVDAPPAAPTGLAAVAGNGSVGLSWDANGEPDVAGYRVFRATTLPVSTTGDGLGGAALISGTSYTDLTVFNGTTYNYVVIAVDAAANRSTASAPASATPSANAGSALDFDGTNDHVTFGTATALGAQSFTIETWFRRDGLGLNTSTGTGGLTTIIPLVTKGRGEAEGSNVDMNWFLGIDTKGTATEADDTLGADFEDNATGLNHPVTGITPVPTSATWHHAAVTYDTATDTWNLYLDGNLERTLSAGGNFTPRSDSIQHAGLATAMTSTGVTAGFFAGVLDEVRIWNTARSAAQIQAARYQQLTSGSGLVARYGLNENTGTAVASSVAGAPTGALTPTANPPVWTTGFPLPDAVPPAAPTGLAASPGNNMVALSWTANSEPDLAGYRVFRGTSLPVPTTGNGLAGAALLTSPSYLDTSAVNGTAYEYVVIAVDAAANRSSASAAASATPSVAAGAALDFDGLNDYVTFGNAAGLNVTDFTIETWFRRDGAGVGVTTGGGGITSAIPLVAKGAQQAETPLNINMNWFLGIDATSGVLVADFEDDANGTNHPVAGVTPVTSGAWHHAAATYDTVTDTWRLYLDGVLDRTLVLAGSFTPEDTSIQHGSLATSLNATGGTNGFFNGALDEVRLWNVVRSDAQIAATMNNTLTSAPGLQARYGLDEGSGTSTASSVAGAPGGTLTNGPAWIVGPPLSPFANSAPVFSTDLLDQNAAEGDAVSLDADATDPDGDLLTYSATGLPAGLAIDANTGVISGTLAYDSAGIYAISVSVTDGTLSDDDSFTLTVNNTNRAPAFTTDITDQNAAEGDAVSLDADATDADADTLIYSATGLPAGLSIDPFSGIISGTLDFGSAGIHNVTVSVTDGTLSDDDSFTLTVSATNQEPTFDQDLGDRTDAEGDLVSLSAGATDPDGDPLTYEATGLPAGLAIDAGTGLISGTLDYAAAAGSPYAVTITVRDGLSVDDSDTFSWTVNNTNRAPAFTTDLLDQNAAEGDAVSLDADATDPDGDLLTYSAAGLPAGLAIDANTGVISGTLAYDSAGIYAISVTVSDGTLSDDDSFTLTVNNTNRAPAFTTDITDQNAAEGDAVSLDADATDADADTLIYSATGLPAGLSIDPFSGIISGTLDFGSAGIHNVTVSVTDGTLSDDDSFTLTVSATNQEPTFDQDLGDRTDAEGDLVSLSAGATDPDGDPLTYEATGLPAGLAIDAGTGLISGTLDYAAAAGSPYAVTITVRDGPSVDDSDTFSWTVNNTNRAPAFSTDITDQNAAEGDAVSLDADATDPDGDLLTYSATGLPNGLSIDPNTGVISGTLAYDSAGIYAISVSVTDGTLSDDDSFTLTVNNTNRAPAFTTDITDQNAAEGDAVSLDADATDADADTLIYSATGLPAGLSIDPFSGIISGTLDFGSAGIHNVTVSVTDGTLSDDDSFTLTVSATNQEPTFDQDLGDRTDAEGDLVSLSAGATDPDGDPLTYEATGLPAGLAIDAGTGLISGTLDYAAAAGSPYAVTITVRDGPSVDDSDTFSWTVNNTNRAPAFSTDITDQNAAEGDAVSLDADATDPDGDLLTYSATGLPNGLSIDPNTGVISGTLAYDSAGIYAISVSVTDGTLSDDDSFTLTVNNTNRAPAFTTDITDQNAAEGDAVSLDADATDADADTLIYSATGLPAGLSIDPFSGIISGTLDFGSAGIHNVTVSVTDGTLSDDDSFTLTVSATNQEPTFDQDLGDRTDAEGDLVSLSAGATDPDGDPLTYEATGLPAGLAIDAGTGLISGTLDYAAAAGSPYAVTITVRDGPSVDDSDTFSWTVNNTNRAPAFTTDLLDQNAAEGDAVSLDADATDPDGDLLTYSAAGLPAGLAIDANTGVISGTLAYDSAGIYAISVSVTDGTLSDDDSFTLTVNNTNRAPAFTTDITDQNAAEGDAVSLDADATDADADTLIYSATGLPAGLSIDPFSGIISGTLDFGSAGIHNVTVSVTDGTLSDDDSFTLTVMAATVVYVNDTFTRTVANGWGNAPVGGAYTTQGTAANFAVGGGAGSITMPNAGVTRSVLLNSTSAADVDVSFGVRINKVAVGGAQFTYAVVRRNGTNEYRVKLRLPTNGNVYVSASTVLNNVESPIGSEVLVAGLSQSANAVLRFRAQVTGSSPTTLRVRAWADASVEPTTWNYTATNSNPALQSAGSLGLRAYVASGTTNAPVVISFDDYLVTSLGPPNQAPVFSTDLGNRTDAEGDGVSLGVDASDPDGNPLTYSATGLPAGITINSATGVISGTLSFASAGVHNVIVTVSDGSLTDDDSFTWTVINTNRAPVFSTEFGDRTDSEGAVISLDADASDADLDPLTYGATGLPGSITVNSVTGVISGILSASSSGVYTVVVTVSDGDLTDTDSFTWTVNDSGSTTIYASDLFSRTVSNGWGSAPTGGAYTLQGAAGAFGVNGSAGTITMGSAGANRSAILTSVSASDVDLTFRVSRDKAPAGGNQFVYGVVRRISASTEYRAQLRLLTNGTVSIRASSVVGNSESPIGAQVQVPGLSSSAATTIWLRAQFIGTSPTTIRIRAWADGSPEPAIWQYTATDSTAALQAAGGVGLRTYISGATSNAPLVFTFDDFLAQSGP